MNWWQGLRLWLDSLARALADPGFLMWLGLVLLLIYWQYRRQAVFQELHLGWAAVSPWRETFDSLLAGLLAGVGGALVLLVLGVSVLDAGILYLWPLALVLMFLHPRYLCFAYAGGLIGLVRLIWGVPEVVSVGPLTALVAVLHGIEAILIWLDGASHPQALYVRTATGQTVGGYLLQRAWPIPMVGMAILFASPADIQELAESIRRIATPDWWPLVSSARQVPAGLQPLVMLVPLVAALGYSDLTVTRPPAEKARRSALHLGFYSLILLVLAVLASRISWMGYLAVVAMPFGHELVILVGQRAETHGRPIYTTTAHRGVGVLEVKPGSPAEAMGLQRGDLIVAANGIPVGDLEELNQALAPWTVGVTLELVRDGRRRVARYAGRVPPLGILTIPEPGAQDIPAVRLPEDTWIDAILRLKRRRR
ncbi:MAG: PDZ domain-containing protein [Limnochordales bacterium]|nr:PDZ domain-containing protein [Limnochordales bacterium]